MKFSNYTKLQEFVKKELFPLSYQDMHEIYTGGSSYNFCVITSGGRYLLKLLQNEDMFLKIKSLNKINGTLHKIATEDFLNYKLVLMTYFDGHRIHYKDFSEPVIRNFWKEYQSVNHFKLNKRLIGDQQDNMSQYNTVEQLLKKARWNIFGYCYDKILKIIKDDLICLSLPRQIIHGDLTANNILVARGENPHIIDWGSVRYGYACEDLASLILQLAGFRTPVGRISRFKKLFSSINKYAQLSSEEWFYGIQAFYLNLLKRRLSNAKKQTFRKNFSLLLVVLGYLRVRSFIIKEKHI
ncbi:MAG: aminoglycoside phosphotransferase family protein [Alphaproteobacteria bacterium]|nr:aminoglycoside phosphotransferase family protein [Alphaproteobacteria bacterium]